MSQRRQEARRAKQERRREERHQSRVGQRRAAVAERPAPAAPAPPRTFWTTRNRWIVFGSLAGLIVLALAAWIISAVRAPLPGEKFPSQGNDHLSSSTQPHDPYNSNPPTSGWHLPPVPRPGVYNQPKIPEDLGHFMEHGGVWVLYNCPEGCESDVQALQRLVDRALDRGRPVALAPFPSMDAKYAVVAWQYLLKQDELDTGKLEDFISRHACRYNPEGGPYCTGVRGKVAEDAQGRDTSNVPIVSPTPFSVFGDQTPAPAGSPAATPPR